MNTYKITFILLTPMAFIDLPTFDGVLSYAFARESNKENHFVQKLNYDKDELIDFSKMPLRMHENGYFIASQMYHSESIESVQRWKKRWANKNDNIADFGKNKRKVDISRGVFKSYDMPIITKDIEKVWFYFQSDDIEQVENLINKWIHFLGKKKSQGFGEIKNFEITKDFFNFAEIYRPIPCEFVDISQIKSFRLNYCAWKPPYWMPENFAKCVVPYE